MVIKTWKTRPANQFIMEILEKKGAMTDTDLLDIVTEEFKDLGYKDFNKILMSLEIGGKIHTTSLTRGKRRIEPRN
ncbi:MAG: hypothetical protein PVF96_02400 [Candidatus Bathyarchaeota archaeon]